MNELSFDKYYFILVHNRTILKKINTQTVFYEMWYIVEYLIVNIFYFFVVFYWEESNTRIIFIHHVLIVQNHSYTVETSENGPPQN